MYSIYIHCIGWVKVTNFVICRIAVELNYLIIYDWYSRIEYIFEKIGNKLARSTLILVVNSFYIYLLLYSEMVKCFNKIATDLECRAVVLAGSGKIFTAGNN